MDPIVLRPHHFLCTLGFKGKGYNPAFIHNFQIYKNCLELEPTMPLELRFETDVICAACPHQRGLKCEQEEKVQAIDRRHAQILRLKEGDRLSWNEAKQRIREHVDSLTELCEGCPWLALGICQNAVDALKH